MTLAAILQLVGLIVPLVEQLFSNRQGAGAQKFDTAMTLVKAAVTAAPTIVGAVQGGQAAIHAGNVEQLTGHIGSLINATVSVANQAGVFQKSGLVQTARPLDAAPAEQGASG